MPACACVAAPPSALEVLKEADARLSDLGREALAGLLAPLLARLHEPLPEDEAATLPEAALAFCRRLYANARSGEALPLARAALAQAERAGDTMLERRAATACGLLSGDVADVVAGIEYHVRVLRLANAAGDRHEMARVWNNIGMAMGIAGNYEIAARCYQRCADLVENEPGPQQSRYVGYANLAQAQLQIDAVKAGLESAQRALREQTPGFRDMDLPGAVLLERNIVRLLVAAGRVAEAQPHVENAVALAERSRTPRAQIAASTTRAVYEQALGQTDVALTRLEQALERARGVPAALRDTLACVVRAEEAAGHSERALLRLTELSDHVYRSAVERARKHIELNSIPSTGATALDHAQQQARARLVAKVAAPVQPEGWRALQSLAATAVMRVDASGMHGKRVGALCKALALEAGVDMLRAVEIGVAAEIHDIGLLSVPEEILAKKGRCSEAERAIARRHVDASVEMLCDDAHPRVFLAREIARYHHAHWDGSGYPERVAGKFIPLAARICAVADAYDDMVCGLYAAPLSMDQALAELHRGAGTQFDPDLVARFDAMIRAETEDLGMDLNTNAGMQGFQELVDALQEDRGFA